VVRRAIIAKDTAEERGRANTVLLQDHHAEIGVRLREEIGGPQAGEPAADHDHVCGDVAGERRAGR